MIGEDIIHILVVDDDTRIRELLSNYLNKNGFFVSVAKDAKDARETIKRYVFDLIILDVMMPEESGIELTESLKPDFVSPILMLTAMNDSEDRVSGLESGANDYLAKPFEPRELLLRINNLINRNKVIEQKIVKFASFKFNIASKKLTQYNNEVFLTSNESNLLAVLTKSKGKAISRENLSKLSGGINERSIDVQITRLRNKIEQNPKQPNHLKTIRNKGYVFLE